MREVIINKDNFEEEVLNSKVPVLVDFWAPWCGPCKMLGPVVEEVAEENNDFKVAKINVDDNQELAMRYKVASIPTLIVFENGQDVKKSVGFIPKEEILNLVK